VKLETRPKVLGLRGGKNPTKAVVFLSLFSLAETINTMNKRYKRFYVKLRFGLIQRHVARPDQYVVGYVTFSRHITTGGRVK